MIQGISRILNCSKVQVATTGLVSTWFAVRYAAADLPPTQRSAPWVAFIGAVTVQLREIINAWTEEDVARTHAARLISQLPAVSTDVPPGFSTIIPVTDPSQTAPARPQRFSLPTRNATMPIRTKLPILLIAFTTIALISGCQSCPELAIYREGLHRVDEPLYQAHLLLLDDAVKAGVRTDVDRQVVQQGIAAARGLYQQAAATQPAN